MTDPITPADLEKLKALCDAATEEACHVHYRGTDTYGNPFWDVITVSMFQHLAKCGGAQAEANARLYAASPTAMPRLIAEVERLREGLEAHDDYCPVCGGERKAATHD